jgi:hypothetical protein
MSKDLFVDSELDSFEQDEEDFEITSPLTKKKRDLEARKKIEALRELKRLREMSGDPDADFDWA